MPCVETLLWATTLHNLRYALQEKIAKNFNFDSHAANLEELRNEYKHSIAMLPFDWPLQECNCVMYALDLLLNPATSFLGHFHANTGFLGWLIDQGHLSLVEGVPQEGSIAAYFSGQKAEHVGIVKTTDRVVSKWGIGHVYEHGSWEVPSSYGSSLQYFTPITSDDVLSMLEVFQRR